MPRSGSGVWDGVICQRICLHAMLRGSVCPWANERSHMRSGNAAAAAGSVVHALECRTVGVPISCSLGAPRIIAYLENRVLRLEIRVLVTVA